MPDYTFKNNETGEVKEVSMKISELDQWKNENNQWTQLITGTPGICDPIRIGIKKPDSSFRDILKNVKHVHKKNNVNDF